MKLARSVKILKTQNVALVDCGYDGGGVQKISLSGVETFNVKGGNSLVVLKDVQGVEYRFNVPTRNLFR